MKKMKWIPIILILLLLTACKGDDEATTEAGYGDVLIKEYQKSSETVDDYNKSKQQQYNGIDSIEDE